MSASARRRIPGPSRNPVSRVVTEGFAKFAEQEASGAIVMLIAAVVSLVIANSPLYASAEAFWHTSVGVTFGRVAFSEPLINWINAGLMALFFLVVGLEIKRELLVGELSEPRKAVLPILAALGGMVAPAIIFVAIARSAGPEAVRGWGVPMATDIAFALGVLALLGKRIPLGLRVFLAALAIADDIGAIIIIAIFYTAQISWVWLGIAALLFLALIALNRSGVDSPWAYFAVGSALWVAMLDSGVQATIAGVLVAVTIPAVSRLSPLAFTDFARRQLREIEEVHAPEAHVLADDTEQRAAFAVCDAARRTAAPLQRMEFALNPIATYVVLPLFALANAGVRLVGDAHAGVPGVPQVVLGVALGLLLGKPLGIMFMTWLATRLGIGDMPGACSWRHVFGVSVLGGIGFTVALFVATLAFSDPVLLGAAKIAVLGASVIAGVAGYAILRTAPSGCAPEE